MDCHAAFIGFCLFFLAAQALPKDRPGLEENDACKLEGEMSWRCKKPENCPSGNSSTWEMCTSNGANSLVCCPPLRSPRAVFRRKALTYCERHLKLCSNESLKRDPHVWVREPPPGMSFLFAVGGVLAGARSHPHMALIGYGEGKEWLCGGSLVSEKFVLSAAHCSSQQKLGPAAWARLGELDYSKEDDDASPQDRRIVERINHPGFKEPPLYNDLALFRLESPVQFTPWVRPVCLHSLDSLPFKKVKATGWGRTGFAEDVSTHLIEIEVSVVPSIKCKELIGSGNKIPQGVRGESMICAGENDGGVDTCAGDSGGPMVIKTSNRCLWTQVGVTSFGKQCALAKSPGIYSRVSYFLPWIESIVWP